MQDLKDLKASNNIVDVIGRYIHLTKRGTEHYGVCPFHNDDKESLQVNEQKQIFKCFPCGDKGGDVMDFLQAYGKSWPDIVKELKDPYNTEAAGFAGEKKTFDRKPVVVWRDAVPDSETVQISHYLYGLPSMVWAYRNADGIPIGYAVRFDRENGQKDVLPYTYKTDGNVSEWRWQGFDKPRPLYNLDKLIANPKITAIVMEGEKTSDAGYRLINTGIATTFMGGADGIKVVDWSPLYGRPVALWADNDYTHAYGDKHPLAGQIKPFEEQPGNKAMLGIYNILKDHCPVIRWIKNPEGTPCGWDLADADWTSEKTMEYVRANIVPIQTVLDDIAAAKSAVQVPAAPSYQIPEDYEAEPETTSDYYRCLGYEKAETGGLFYYFYAFEAKSVIKLAPSSMSKSNLMQVAPLNHWEGCFPAKNGMSVDSAQNFLINTCHKIGVFNEKWLRGRGAWIDKKDVVIHAGNYLIINGIRTNFSRHQSKYIYEIGDELGFDISNPIVTKQSALLMEVLSMLNWERGINSYLLAGWCVVAPVCGALNWRPHIWLTGAAGTGKSWVFLKIVRRLLGEASLAVQGETSEAGLRQTLKHDALPIVFDEAEGSDRKDQERMQSVLALMRQSSATDGGVMAKGSAGGTAKTYRIRSCFAFASIGIPIAKQSDYTRVTPLSLMKHSVNTDADRIKKEENWKALQAKYDEVITDEFCQGLRARTIKLLPVILKNARTFSNAAAAVLGEQRTGDQIGALLAGAYSLVSPNEISFDNAVKWVKERDWSEERAQDSTRDELSLLSHIMEQMTRVEGHTGVVERNIGELTMLALGYREDVLLTADNAHDRLKRLGIKVKLGTETQDEPYLYISDSADGIKKMLKDTAWSKNHHKILLRIESAEPVASTRFSTGMSTRAVKISTKIVFKDKI